MVLLRYGPVLAVVLLAGVTASPVAGDTASSQPGPAMEFRVNRQRAAAVKDAFKIAWDGYYKYAFPKDQLNPQTNDGANTRNGWGASAVDALSTAIVMEDKDIVKQIIDYVPKINFNQTTDSVSLFETTIRYLGGLLAGYDLLEGPFSHLSSDKNAKAALLKQAKNLADDLSFAFNTPTGIPSNTLILAEQSLGGDTTNGLATIGTLVLEWVHLSDLLGDKKYGALAEKAESYLLKPKPGIGEPFPGLLGTNVYLANGSFADSFGGWVGGDDSYYEYLIKMWAYDSSRFGLYKDRWIAAADSTIKYLASNPSSRPDLTFLAVYNGQKLIYESEHLACFAGGNFILGGLVLGEKKYTDFGIKLTTACHETYTGTATGIGPEIFDWIPSTCKNTGPQAPPTYEPPAYEPPSYVKRSPKLSASPEASPDAYNRIANDSPPPATLTVVTPPSTSTPPSTPPAKPDPCALPTLYNDQTAFYNKTGFYITDANYDLRPEVVESIYYAYRVTGDPKYQEWAWNAFLAINSTTRVGSGYSQVKNVNVKGGGGFTNNQESFFFAELMKYLYLIHSEDGMWQVNYKGRNEYVYNTEAHPFKVAGKALPTY
ncbi:glycoside hydrolase family 47 protein [Microthyrium microscopicum]|uniref:alpha-1,2-Mannosidase n=1 Tax=Microthyrium microscopicum TaxID=703497 RepID=A0A6A6U6U8_9PEZI|nr:glycoside hydrolase family 47 protein [Microthyrium microscopicum]